MMMMMMMMMMMIALLQVEDVEVIILFSRNVRTVNIKVTIGTAIFDEATKVNYLSTYLPEHTSRSFTNTTYFFFLSLSLVDRQVGARQAGARAVSTADRNHLAAGQQQPGHHQDRGSHGGAQLEGPDGHYLWPIGVVSAAHQRALQAVQGGQSHGQVGEVPSAYTVMRFLFALYWSYQLPLSLFNRSVAYQYQ